MIMIFLGIYGESVFGQRFDEGRVLNRELQALAIRIDHIECLSERSIVIYRLPKLHVNIFLPDRYRSALIAVAVFDHCSVHFLNF